MEDITSTQDDRDEKEYVLVPPNGGWGYFVCFGLSLIFTTCIAQKALFGFIYNDFLEEIGAGTGDVAVVYGVFQVALAFGGFSTNIILKKLTIRQTGLLAAFIYTLGSFLAIFVTSVTYLVITHGLLHGLGLGILMPVSYVSFNSYFTRNKLLYLSLCKATIGMVTMIYPMIIKVFIAEYGFRGTLAILAAISTHIIFGVLLMQPVEWHMIKVLKSNEESGFLSKNLQKVVKLEPLQSVHDKIKGCKSQEMLSIEHLKEKERRRSIPLAITQGKSQIDYHSLDCMDIENVDTVSTPNLESKLDVLPPFTEKKRGIWSKIVEILDLGLLKDWVFVNITIGLAFSYFAEMTFIVVEPLFLHKCNLSKTEIANIIGVGGGADMVTRVLLGISAYFLPMRARYVYYTGALAAAIINIVIVQFTTYMPLLILTGLMGVVRSLVQVPPPLVVADHVTMEKYPAAFGMGMLLIGVTSLTVGPIVGFIRDYLGNYAITFVSLGICNLFCAVPWTIEAAIKLRNRRRVL